MFKPFGRIVRFVAVLGLLCGIHAVAQAEGSYPSSPIRLIIPQSPGSGGDLVGRMLGKFLTQDLHEPVVVENVAGANGIVAATEIAHGKPDGYTIMLGLVSQLSFNQYLYKNIGYDGFKDFTYINPVVETPYVLVASKKSGIRNFADFVKAAKAKPGKLDFASAGTGNMTHLSMALLASKLGVDLTHIPYKGSNPALLSVVSGESDLMVSVLGAALPQIVGGNVVPIAVLGANRAQQIPSVPTLKDLHIEIPHIPGWYALVGPARMSVPVRDKLSKSVQRFLEDRKIDQQLTQLYLYPMPGSGTQLLARAKGDADTWHTLINNIGLSPN